MAEVRERNHAAQCSVRCPRHTDPELPQDAIDHLAMVLPPLAAPPVLGQKHYFARVRSLRYR